MKTIDTTLAKRQYEKPAMRAIEIQTEAIMLCSSEIPLGDADEWE